MSEERSRQPSAEQAGQPLNEERAERPSGGDRLLDFLERAQALFHGKWFVLTTCTVAASILLSLINIFSSWSMLSGSLYVVASVVLPLILVLINLTTMFALIRRTDESTLNARRKYEKFVFVLCVIGGVMIALSVLMLLSTSLLGSGSLGISAWLLMLPLLAIYALILDYQRSLNGFYKNLYGITQGLYIRRAYAKRAGYENIVFFLLTAFMPYILAALIPMLSSELSYPTPVWDAVTIVSDALSLLNAAFTFLFFRQAESVERAA